MEVFHGCFKGVSSKFQGVSKKVSSILYESFEYVS